MTNPMIPPADLDELHEDAPDARRRRLSCVWPEWLIEEVESVAAEGRFRKGFLISLVNEEILSYVTNALQGKVKDLARQRA